MRLDEIRELIRLMKENQLAEIDLEQEGEKLRLVAAQLPPAPPGGPAPAVPAAGAPLPAEPTSGVPAPLPEEDEGETIDSPMVGTFYRAPAPDADDFVEPGDEFDEDTVLCIVEAMKVMNEIKAERRGKIVKALVENGQPVEFGQPLFVIEPAE